MFRLWNKSVCCAFHICSISHKNIFAFTQYDLLVCICVLVHSVSFYKQQRNLETCLYLGSFKAMTK